MNKKETLNFFDKQSVVILSTIGLDNSIQTRALINIRNSNIAPHLVEYFKKNDRIILITNTHSEKIAQIRKNHLASLYAYDNEYTGFLLTGSVKEILDPETKNAIWHDNFLMYYPNGRDGGDFSVLEFTPDEYKKYSDFSVNKGKIVQK